jgi:hypothetical protein
MAINVNMHNYGGRDLIESIVKNYYDKIGASTRSSKIISTSARWPRAEKRTLKNGTLIK